MIRSAWRSFRALSRQAYKYRPRASGLTEDRLVLKGSDDEECPAHMNDVVPSEAGD